MFGLLRGTTCHLPCLAVIISLSDAAGNTNPGESPEAFAVMFSGDEMLFETVSAKSDGSGSSLGFRPLRIGDAVEMDAQRIEVVGELAFPNRHAAILIKDEGVILSG